MHTGDTADMQIESATGVGRAHRGDAPEERPARAKATRRLGSGVALLVFGVALVGIGVIVTRFSSRHESGDGTFVVFVGPILAGIVMSVQGVFRLLSAIVSMPAAIAESRATSGTVKQAAPDQRDAAGPRSADGSTANPRGNP